MAFASTLLNKTSIGNRFLVTGTFANTGGSTGGEVPTGLRSVEYFALGKAGAAVDASQYAANETFPTAVGSITVVTTADQSGTWMAIGYD